MKINELIELLEEYPNQDAEVLVIESENWQYDVMNKDNSIKTELLWGDSGNIDMLIIE